MASLTIDVVEGGELESSIDDNGRVIYTGIRAARVSGLKTGADDDAKTCLARAEMLVRASYPPGTPYDDAHPSCLLRGYRTFGIPNFSSAARVLLQYKTPGSTGGDNGDGTNGSIWSVSDDTELTEDKTQIDFASGKPLRVTIGKNQQKIKDIANVSFPSTVRTVVLTGTTDNTHVETLRGAINQVNDADLLGLPKGFWRFSRLRDVFEVGANYYNVTVELSTRISRNWATLIVLRDSNTGKYVNVKDADMVAASDKLKGSNYKYGFITTEGDNKGVIVVGLYKLASLGTTLGTLPI
jgi:hypothetical protein